MDQRSEILRRLADPAPISAAALGDLAIDAFDHGLFEAMVKRIEQAIAAGANDARLYQMLGLARRELLDGAGAAAAYARAAALAPHDVLIAHGLARSTWEAGQPATARYEAALRLAPRDAGLLIGRAAALAAEGRAGEGEAQLARLLAENPGWQDGHLAYARLVAAYGIAADGTRTVRAALAQYPADPALWQLLQRMLLDTRRFADALQVARAAAQRLGPNDDWRRAEAVALSELGDAAAAQRLFDRLPLLGGANGLIFPIRNLIRLGRFDQALALAERPFAAPEEAALWPYRALLWRVLGDARWAWLEGDARLIGAYDLALSAAQIEGVVAVLRALHSRSGELPAQSARGGTQTDGNLLARAEPEIVALRVALLDAIDTHIAQLPPPVPGHPTLIDKSGPVRISGSWSIRLSGAGFHVDHVHPQGWLSSACHLVVPAGTSGHEGWLAFGESHELLPDLEAFRLIEPKPGRLVLFPSTMWHGTRPFAEGERISVAFDVARP